MGKIRGGYDIMEDLSLGGEGLSLIILGTTDIHSNLYGFSYEENRETENNGLARIASYIRKKREEGDNLILIDNGDSYQGSILSDAIYNKRPEVIHPVSKALNYLAYDAVVLGNHEFNFGLDFIGRIGRELDMPVLASNVGYRDGRQLVQPYTIVERAGLRIGILGLTNPNVPRWEGDRLEGLDFQTIVEAGKKYGNYLKEEEGVDLLIVSAHVGLLPEYDKEAGGDGAERLLEEFKDIDVLLLGHYHTSQVLRRGKTLIGAARDGARELVEFKLDLVREESGYRVSHSELRLVDMEDYEPDRGLRELIGQEHQASLDFIRGGNFGQATGDFQPENEILGLPEVRLRDSPLVELIGRVQQEASGSDVTAVALFHDGASLNRGQINYASLFNIYRFDNSLCRLDLSGRELRAYMEWSMEYYNQWKEGDISISFNRDIPGYRYDIFKGLDYKVDLSRPPGSRVRHIKFRGQDLREDQVLSLSVNNYRYSSGLKAYGLVKGSKNWESPKSIRDYLADYIERRGEVRPEMSKNWELIGISLDHPLREGIIGLVNSGQLASPYHSSLNIYELEEAGLIKDGRLQAPGEVEED